ncbi:MMPL family transporter [Streptomyces sp. SID3212]|uniref:MMPL family transporter n=1 Tax=Streptomyces sp. SID3212 TaxID=2690259 RepID=UPI001369284A|nr:MMPL family transporter [Streptomyces sp. SID3212]MYV57596.1 MMPL family transporter [Streptomyces sp. SID3212]
MSALARWCYRHRLLTALIWLGVLVGLGAVSNSVGSAYSTTLSAPSTESSKALDLLKKNSPAASGDRDTVVWHTTGGKVTDSAVRQDLTGVLDRISRAPGVASVASPYAKGGAGQISKDGATAYAAVTLDKAANDVDKTQVEHVISLVKQARTDTVDVQYGGQAFKAAENELKPTSEIVGVIAALLIMLLLFRSLWAAALPILTAVAGVGAGILGTGVLSHTLSIPDVATTVAALVGLGVGIDYALFIVNRHRKGLMAGASVEDAAARALDTSGRAVIFAGLTVVVALLGQYALGIGFLNGMAAASALTVALTVLASITLLPALLGLMGHRVLSRKQRRTLREHGPVHDEQRGVWGRWASAVLAKPRGKALLALLVMVVVSLPVFSLRLGSADAGNDPSSSASRQSYDLLADGFGPGFNGPLLLVAQAPHAQDKTALESLAAALSDVKGVAQVVAPPLAPGQDVGTIQVVPTSSPQSVQTTDLITHLRDTVVPRAEQNTDLQVYVGGSTASGVDFSDVIVSKLPLFIVIIVSLGCLLMMVAFRSVLVPLIGVVMNLLTMGVAFGAVVAAFQWGWVSEALGAGAAGPVEAFAPVMMIAILFGLSMDYQVFLISRMHEEWTLSRDNARAVRIGQAETGRIITAAAVIMACVFAAFMFSGQRIVAEFGLGLALAVLLDVLLVRMVVVPALMHLFGARNWWLPRRLDKLLPHLSIEGTPDDAPDTAADRQDRDDRQDVPVGR